MVFINHRFSNLDVPIEIMDDGPFESFINITKICTIFDKRWSAYLRNDTTKGNIAKIANKLNVEVENLIKTNDISTFVHPFIAFIVADWIDEEFGKELRMILDDYYLITVYETFKTEQEYELDLSNFEKYHESENNTISEYQSQLEKTKTLQEELQTCEQKLKDKKYALDIMSFTWDVERDLYNQYEKWENDWKTIYQIGIQIEENDGGPIYLTDSEIKKLEITVLESHRKRYDGNVPTLTKVHTLREKWELFADFDSLNPELIKMKPKSPDCARGSRSNITSRKGQHSCSKLSPTQVHIYHNRDWDLAVKAILPLRKIRHRFDMYRMC